MIAVQISHNAHTQSNIHRNHIPHHQPENNPNQSREHILWVKGRTVTLVSLHNPRHNRESSIPRSSVENSPNEPESHYPDNRTPDPKLDQTTIGYKENSRIYRSNQYIERKQRNMQLPIKHL
jgi:hypothetical protein